MNVRTTLKTAAATTLIALSLGGASAQADTALDINRRPVPGWHDGQNFPPRPIDYRDDARQARIDQRQDEQMERILHGIEYGRLDSKELFVLLKEQREIGKLERAYLADGFLTRFEYQALEDRLDAAERRIFREKHDRGWDRWSAN